jgi:hypothetical protein
MCVCVGVLTIVWTFLEICIFVFTLFYNVCTFLYCFVYVYLFLFLLSVLVYGLLPPSDNSIAVSNSSSSSSSSSSSITIISDETNTLHGRSTSGVYKSRALGRRDD